MNDNELIEEIKEQNCEDSLKKLILRHENLYYKICHKYAPTLRASGISPEDLFEDKSLVIYKAVKTFDPSRKTKFSTWLGNYTRYHCLNYIQNNTKYLTLEDPNDINILVNKNAMSKYNETKRTDEKEFCFSILGRLKDKRILRIFQLRYSDETEFKPTWANIAKHIDASTQTVINLHSKGKNILRNKITSKQTNDVV